MRLSPQARCTQPGVLDREMRGPLTNVGLFLRRLIISETVKTIADRPRLRNRWFADSPLEQTGFEPLVPLGNELLFLAVTGTIE